MKFLDKLKDELALRVFKLIKSDEALRMKLTGWPGPKGDLGMPADYMYRKWLEVQKPEVEVWQWNGDEFDNLGKAILITEELSNRTILDGIHNLPTEGNEIGDSYLVKTPRPTLKDFITWFNNALDKPIKD